MSLGVLTEEEVAGIRVGTISNPTVDKLVALARVFGVEPGYFLDGVGEPPMSTGRHWTYFGTRRRAP